MAQGKGSSPEHTIQSLIGEIQKLDRTKRDLLERMEQMASLLDNLPGIAFRCLYDEELTFEYASRGIADLLGYEASEIVNGYAFRQLVHPEDQLQNRKILSQLSPETNRYQLIYRMRAADGDDRWVHEQGTAIFSESGEVEAIEGLLTDITSQKLEEIKLRQENERLLSSMKERYRLGTMIGKSAAMQRVYDRILKAASSSASVIITGESGTGKELAAREIHNLSDRRDRPFVAVNCGAIPENLIESEFFGYVKGAFTGAAADRTGFLMAANQGTLFLDEIGEMPPAFQVKLLRALDGKGFTPVGDNRVHNSDFRLISATNRNLPELVRSRRMREDFYYRISTVPIELPPLRERKEDLPLLIDHLLDQYGQTSGRTFELPPTVLFKLLDHHWPGNVRELHNVLNRYLTLEEIDLTTLHYRRDPESPVMPSFPEPDTTGPANLSSRMDQVEKAGLLRALEENRWHIGRSAAALGLSRRTLQRRIKKYALK